MIILLYFLFIISADGREYIREKPYFRPKKVMSLLFFTSSALGDIYCLYNALSEYNILQVIFNIGDLDLPLYCTFAGISLLALTIVLAIALLAGGYYVLSKADEDVIKSQRKDDIL